MFPAALLALPLMLPVLNPSTETRVDFVAAAPVGTLALSERSVAPFTSDGAVIPPLYARPDGGILLSLSPGSPCTAACVRLRVRF